MGVEDECIYLDIWFFRINDSSVFVHVGNCTMSLDRILSLVTALALIITLCFLFIVFQDLKELWVEVEYMWETFNDYWIIIQNQDQKIMDLMMIISKAGVGV